MAVEIHNTRIASVGAATGIRTVLHSDGEIFWHSLTSEQHTANEARIREIEISLGQHFDRPDIPRSALQACKLNLETALEMQTDNHSYSFIAAANALRILDEPRNEYSLQGLQQRSQLLHGVPLDQLTAESLEMIFRSGAPFDKFHTAGVPDMLTFLGKLKEGSVALLDWPYSPTHIRKFGVDYTHARTVTGFTHTGFTDNSNGLYFHLIDPYYYGERVYSFRDLVVACLLQTVDLVNGVTVDSVNRVARSAWIIERATSPIRTLAAAV